MRSTSSTPTPRSVNPAGVARLAREWLVDGSWRIEDALPSPPSADELAAAEHRLDEIERTIVEIEAAAAG